MNTANKVVVVGGGVIGLSVAIELLQRGYQVILVAAKITPFTTSDVAAAFYYAFHVDVEPLARGLSWNVISYRKFGTLSHVPSAGVVMAPCTILAEESIPSPDWAPYVHDFERVIPDGAFAEYQDGFAFKTAIIDMSMYMPFLTNLFLELGGELQQATIASMDAEELQGFDAIVNCTGLAARELVNDPSVFPIRGQVVVLQRPKEMRPFVMLAEGERTGFFHITTRTDQIYLGGTIGEHDESLAVIPEQSERIYRRALQLYPELASLPVLGSRVGLRPGRARVRLEQTFLSNGQPIVHAYGTGGAGVTLSWGMSAEVCEIISSLLTGSAAAAAA